MAKSNPLDIPEVYNIDMEEDFIDDDIRTIFDWRRTKIGGADEQSNR